MRNFFLLFIAFLSLIGCAKSSTTNTPACATTSVFKAKYSTNVTYDISTGCVNTSGYTSMTFNAENDTLTLSGNSVSSLTFSLSSGGGGCAVNKTGGDTWASGSYDLSTQVSSALQVNSTNLGIACSSVSLQSFEEENY